MGPGEEDREGKDDKVIRRVEEEIVVDQPLLQSIRGI